MPGFAGGPNDLAALSDQQVVLLGNYLLDRYGRPGINVTAKQVAEVRSGGPSSPLVALARVAVAAAVATAALIVVIMIMRARRRERTNRLSGEATSAGGIQ